MVRVFNIKTGVWVYEGPSAWYFVTIDKKTSKAIKQIPILKRGWGSIPVNVTVGKTKWKTSIFPDKDGVYLLPLKKSARTLENIRAGSKIKLDLEIIEDYFLE